MLSDIALNVVMLSIITLNVVRPSVIMPSVVTPFENTWELTLLKEAVYQWSLQLNSNIRT